MYFIQSKIKNAVVHLPWIICCKNAGIPGENAATAAILAAAAAPSDSTGAFVGSPIEVEELLIMPDWNAGDESFCCVANKDKLSWQWFSNMDCGVMGIVGTDGGIGGGEGEEGREPMEFGLEPIRFGKGNMEVLFK